MMPRRPPEGPGLDVPEPELPQAQASETDTEGANTMTSRGDMQVALSRPVRAEPAHRWGTVLTVRFPDGVERHPRVLDIVEQELGRPCAIDTDDSGVRLSCGIGGTSREEAENDAGTVASHVLSLLGLGPAAVAECHIAPRVLHPDDADGGERHLAVVLDLQPVPSSD